MTRKLHARTTIDDFVAFQRYHHAESPAVRKGRWAILVPFPLLVVSASTLAAWHVQSWVPIAVACAISVVYLIITATRGEKT